VGGSALGCVVLWGSDTRTYRNVEESCGMMSLRSGIEYMKKWWGNIGPYCKCGLSSLGVTLWDSEFAYRAQFRWCLFISLLVWNNTEISATISWEQASLALESLIPCAIERLEWGIAGYGWVRQWTWSPGREGECRLNFPLTIGSWPF
jgi:hypothetical protein